MIKIKAGDPVEYIDGGIANKIAAYPDLMGKVGTVERLDVGEDGASVLFPGDVRSRWVYLHNLRPASTRATGKTTRAILQTILDLSNGKDVVLNYGGPGLPMRQQALHFRNQVMTTMKQLGCFLDIFDSSVAGPIACKGGGKLTLINVSAGAAGNKPPVILTSI